MGRSGCHSIAHDGYTEQCEACSSGLSDAHLTADALLRGSLFALEQCGLLLNDAALLLEHQRWPSSAGVALLAREELGRSRILRHL
jgi:HEPN superfamily AbiV-like protein